MARPVPETLAAANHTRVWPATEGVPVMTPVAALRLKPAGSVPLVTAKPVAAGLAVRVKLKPTPTWPWLTTGALVITGAAAEGAMAMERIDAGPVPTVLVAETVTAKVPNTVGVPLITPVPAVSARPAGRPPAL